MTEAIIRAYNEYLETGIIEEPSAHIFDELLDRGIIKGSTTPLLSKYYLDKVEQARKEIVKELLKTKSVNKVEVNSIKTEFEKITNGDSIKVQIRAKKIVLQEFFEKHKAKGTDIEKLIR